MSFTRRLAAGLPAVGVTVLAALALAGSPANAAPGESAARAGQPAVMATPCADQRTGCADAGADDYDAAAPTDTPGTAGADDDTRGEPGYGGESPTTTPQPSRPTPTGTTDTVPPGVSPTTVAPSPTGTTPGGVSAGGNLPLTGAPVGATLTVGALMIAGGATAVWYTRRRRTAA